MLKPNLRPLQGSSLLSTWQRLGFKKFKFTSFFKAVVLVVPGLTSGAREDLRGLRESHGHLIWRNISLPVAVHCGYVQLLCQCSCHSHRGRSLTGSEPGRWRPHPPLRWASSVTSRRLAARLVRLAVHHDPEQPAQEHTAQVDRASGPGVLGCSKLLCTQAASSASG
jgi:hypothetical protein